VTALLLRLPEHEKFNYVVSNPPGPPLPSRRARQLEPFHAYAQLLERAAYPSIIPASVSFVLQVILRVDPYGLARLGPTSLLIEVGGEVSSCVVG
jgi:hypothetical protein